jgi:hypothetical protein
MEENKLSEFARIIQEGKKAKKEAEENKKKNFLEKYNIEKHDINPINFLSELTKLKREADTINTETVHEQIAIIEPVVEKPKTPAELLAQLAIIIQEGKKSNSSVFESSKDELEPFVESIVKDIVELKSEENVSVKEIIEDELPVIENSLIDKAAKSITKSAENTNSSLTKVTEKVSPNLKAIQDKLSHLEKWIGKISAAGSGSGSYWLNDLGDTDKQSILNATNTQVLTFNAAISKWVAADPQGGGLPPVDQPARTMAERATIIAESAYAQANTATTIAESAYAQANIGGSSIDQTARTQANTANLTAVSAFDRANSEIIGTAAYGQANIAIIIAQASYVQANSEPIGTAAFNKANTTNTLAQTAFDRANSEIIGTAAYGQANIATLIGQSAYTQANTTNTIAISAYNQTNAAFLQANTPSYVANSAGLYANSAYVQANAAFLQANTVFGQSNSSFALANAGFLQANTGFTQANLAYAQANGGFIQANTATTIGQSSYDRANTAFDRANSEIIGTAAYVQANTARIIGEAAYSTANLKFNTSGGTITGQTTISANLIVTGANVSLGNIANVRIYGGNTGQLLSTDNFGNLSFIEPPTSNTISYTAATISLTNGVYVSGSVTDVQVLNDSNFYSITDGSNTGPAWIITCTFTGVTSFNRVVSNIDYTLASGHVIYFQVYNYVTLTWDNIGSYSGASGYAQYALEVLGYTSYISGGTVQARLYHSNTGNVSHVTKLDYFALEKSAQGSQGPRGPTGPTGSTGSAGAGIATGGTPGQVLIKNSSTDYDTTWSNNLTYAYNTGNLAFTQANTATTIGQSAYIQANTATTIGQAAYDRANSEIIGTSAYVQANTATTIGQSAYDKANSANTLAVNSYIQANASFIQANSANTLAANSYIQANASFIQANSANTLAANSYIQANAAFIQANTDFTNISITSGTYGNTTYVPVITVSANGRITNIVNTAITFSGGGGGAGTGQFVPNIGTWTSGATAVINVNTVDQYNITGLSTNITISVTSTVTPNDGQRLMIRIRDNGTARNLTWTQTANQFRFIGISPPTITSVNKLIYIGCVYNAADGYWDLISSLTQP